MPGVALLAGVLLFAGCAAGKPLNGRYPGDAGECDNLPVYERGECRERFPPLHPSCDLRKPELR